MYGLNQLKALAAKAMTPLEGLYNWWYPEAAQGQADELREDAGQDVPARGAPEDEALDLAEEIARAERERLEAEARAERERQAAAERAAEEARQREAERRRLAAVERRQAEARAKAERRKARAAAKAPNTLDVEEIEAAMEAFDADDYPSADKYAKALVAELKARGKIKVNPHQGAALAKKIAPHAAQKFYTAEKGAVAAGYTVKESGKDVVKDDDEVVVWIKQYLPEAAHGYISQALNDVALGRGKATSGHDALHASSGDGANSCTLFFTRDPEAATIATIVGIGMHISSDSYTICYGNEIFGNTLDLAKEKKKKKNGQ